MTKEIKRGYVKWTDEDGTFHKEPLADHPELLNSASPKEQLQAEEVRRLNDHGEEVLEKQKDEGDANYRATTAALKKADDDVLTAGDLTTADDGKGGTTIVPVKEVEEKVAEQNEAPKSGAEETGAPAKWARVADDDDNDRDTDNG